MSVCVCKVRERKREVKNKNRERERNDLKHINTEKNPKNKKNHRRKLARWEKRDK